MTKNISYGLRYICLAGAVFYTGCADHHHKKKKNIEPSFSVQRLSIRGDSSDDGKINLTDAIHTLNYRNGFGPEPKCLDAADSNDDGRIDDLDFVYTVNHLFKGGPSITAPYPEAGTDPTADELLCDPILYNELNSSVIKEPLTGEYYRTADSELEEQL